MLKEKKGAAKWEFRVGHIEVLWSPVSEEVNYET